MSNPMWRCPKCGHEAPESEWPEGEVYCDDCGNHMAVMCPQEDCDFGADDIWTHVHELRDGVWYDTDDDTPVPGDWKSEDELYNQRNAGRWEARPTVLKFKGGV